MNLNLNTTNRLGRQQLRVIGVLLISLVYSNLPTQGQQLEVYIEEAIKNNPNIQAVETRHAISIEKISEAKAFPNTEFSGGYMFGKTNMPMMQQAEFTVMQMFPWFGTISARTKYASTVSDADYVNIDIEKRRITMLLSQSYYRLYEIAKKQEILDSNIELLQVYEQMALTSLKVGKASAVSVLKFQIRQNDLLERKSVLKQDFEAELTTFNKLMNREDVSEIPIIDSLSFPQKEVEVDFANISLHPELIKYEELNKIVAQADVLNKKESAPELGVGLQYMLFNKSPNMIMPMVSLSIPIFNRKFKSISRQNQLRYEEISNQKQATKNSLMTQLQSTIRNRNAARISWETLEKNLKQAQNATEILLKNYETGTIDFREVLDIQELQLKFQLNQIEAKSNYYKQLSIINYYTTEK